MTLEELNGKNKEELKHILKNKGIDFKASDNKEELIALLVEPTSDEETTNIQVTEPKKIEFRTHDNANFVGFVHPSTRKLVTVNEEGKLFIDETDSVAIAILDAAKDVFKA